MQFQLTEQSLMPDARHNSGMSMMLRLNFQEDGHNSLEVIQESSHLMPTMNYLHLMNANLLTPTMVVKMSLNLQKNLALHPHPMILFLLQLSNHQTCFVS